MIQIKAIIIALLGLSIAKCTPIEQRSAATVLTDLATIGTDVSTLTTDVQSYTGGLTEALTIATDENTLDTAINQATTDTTAASSFSTSDSTSVVAAVASLTPKITSGLSALAAKVFCMNSNLQFFGCS
jgi:Hydrophobic surface binding protein A